jgi:hypothetical protein
VSHLLYCTRRSIITAPPPLFLSPANAILFQAKAAAAEAERLRKCVSPPLKTPPPHALTPHQGQSRPGHGRCTLRRLFSRAFLSVLTKQRCACTRLLTRRRLCAKRNLNGLPENR